MDGSFSFLNNKVYTFPISRSPSIQGNIACLNAQMARVYFTQSTTNAEGVAAVHEIESPSDIQVHDITLREAAPRLPPNNNFILMWTSDYEIQYRGQLILKLKMQRQYSCRLTPYIDP